MMSTPPNSLEDVYLHLIGLGSDGERAEWIYENLGGKPALREEVLKLLAAGKVKGILDETDPPLLQAGRLIRDLSGEEIGPYLLIKPLGSGGMGDVYLAHEREPVARPVAIKLLRLDVNIQADMKRFLRERQIMGGFQHPNIAQIFTAGLSPDGYSYIVMEHVEGTDLDHYCRERSLPLRKRIELFLQCCRAIEHAHQKGIIHRDIKPSNVMVTEIGGVATVKVIDFGIAKFQEIAGEVPSHSTSSSYGTDFVRNVGSDAITRGNLSPGTPPFMSPEQCSGDPALVDTRSDIYSLGALLYKLLTDRLPYDWVDRPENTIRTYYVTAMTSAAKLPSRCAPHLERQLQGDLDSIIGMAMHRDSNMRYASVGELVSDLNNYLEYRPVRANPLTVLQGAKKYLRRHRLALAATGVAIAGLLVGLCLALVQSWRAQRSEKVAISRAYTSDLLLAKNAFDQTQYGRVAELLERNRAVAMVKDPLTGHGIQRLDWRLLHARLPMKPLEIQDARTKIYFGLSIPSREEVASGDRSSILRVFSRLGPKEDCRLKIKTEQKEINGLALSPDGRWIATAGDNGSVKFWDVETGRLEKSFQASERQVFQCKWTHDGKYFVTVGNEHAAVVWSVPDFKEFKRFDTRGRSLECMDIGPNGQLVFGSNDGIVRIGRVDGDSIETEELTLVPYRVLNANICSTVVYSPSGKMLGLGFDFGYLVLLREVNGRFVPVERIRFPTTVTAIAFNKDESQAIVGEKSGKVHRMTLPAEWPVKSRLELKSEYLGIHAKFDIGGGRTLKSLWDVVESATPGVSREGVPLDMDRIYLKLSQPIPMVQYSEYYVRTWYSEAGETSPEWTEMPSAVVFRDDGVELRFAVKFGVWKDENDLRKQGRLESWKPHEKRVSGLVWSGDEKSIQSFSEDGKVCSTSVDRLTASVINSSNVDQFIPLSNRNIFIHSASSPVYVGTLREDGKLQTKLVAQNIATIHADPNRGDVFYGFRYHQMYGSHLPAKLYRWVLEDLKQEEISIAERDVPLDRFLGTTSDGKLVLRYRSKEVPIGSNEGKSYLLCWDPKTSRSVWEVNVPNEDPRAIVQSREGRYFAFVMDQVLYLLDTSTGTLQSVPEDYLNPEDRQAVLTLAFSPDQKFLAVVLKDNSLHCIRVSDRQCVWRMKIPGGDAISLVWSKDGKTILTAARDGYVRTIDADIGEVTVDWKLGEFDRDLEQMKLSPEEDLLYLVDREGRLYGIPLGDQGSETAGK
jgi:serine/threonine protein kinase/WD40 repeat protein